MPAVWWWLPEDINNELKVLEGIWREPSARYSAESQKMTFNIDSLTAFLTVSCWRPSLCLHLKSLLRCCIDSADTIRQSVCRTVIWFLFCPAFLCSHLKWTFYFLVEINAKQLYPTLKCKLHFKKTKKTCASISNRLHVYFWSICDYYTCIITCK